MVELIEVELLKAHTHGGNMWPRGAKIKVQAHKVNRLIELGVAKKVITEEPFRPTRRQRVTTDET